MRYRRPDVDPGRPDSPASNSLEPSTSPDPAIHPKHRGSFVRIARKHPQPPTNQACQHAARGHDHRRALGRLGETIAAAHLERQGFAIVDRNARTKHGEIDIVAFDGVTLAFVEVKSRCAGASSDRSAMPVPLEGLRPAQRARLRRLALAWLNDHDPRLRPEELRFDAIGVVMDRRAKLLSLDHVEGAW